MYVQSGAELRDNKKQKYSEKQSKNLSVGGTTWDCVIHI